MMPDDDDFLTCLMMMLLSVPYIGVSLIVIPPDDYVPRNHLMTRNQVVDKGM